MVHRNECAKDRNARDAGEVVVERKRTIYDWIPFYSITNLIVWFYFSACVSVHIGHCRRSRRLPFLERAHGRDFRLARNIWLFPSAKTRRAFFSTVCCPFNSADSHLSGLFFLPFSPFIAHLQCMRRKGGAHQTHKAVRSFLVSLFRNRYIVYPVKFLSLKIWNGT